jgi:predicted transport protein
LPFSFSEYTTGKQHGGRIDTLGIDENGCPVIIEYKRTLNENVINQGLFYLDWLMDHKAEFELLVQKTKSKELSENIEWNSPRLLCIAGDFTKYDEHAVQQINRNIELIRYRKYGDEFILFELVNATTSDNQTIIESANDIKREYKSVSEYLEQSSNSLKERFENLKNEILALGDDVQIKILKHYIAFKRIKNFICVEFNPQIETIVVYLRLNPDEIELEEGYSRDVRKIGHHGTGEIEVRVKKDSDLEKLKLLLVKCYEGS